MSASEFLAAFFDATSSASIYVCSLSNERDNGQSGEAKLVGRGDFARIDTFVQRHDLAGRGTFFCVNTVQPKQSRRTKETIAEIVALHADIDLDKVALAADEVRRRIAQLQMPPTWVVFSGHGFHLYWVLTEALDATPDNVERVERLLHQLADHVGGDPSVCEIARLMRVPGSHNTKDGGHVEVRIISGPGGRHEISDVEDWLDGARPFIPRKDATPQGRNPFLDVDLPGGGAPVDVEARLAAMRYQGSGDTSIHQTQLAATAAMLNRGTAVDEVVDTILAATRAAAGDAGTRWNWHREERDVRNMCEAWRRKKANGQHSQGTGTSDSKPESWRQHAMTASELQDKQFPALTYVVDRLIPEGLTILAGRPKVGKTWLALDVCLAVASGTTALGNISTTAGDVLYCALEDNFRRLRGRVEKLLPPLAAWPERLTVATKWRRLDVGGVADIAEWCGGVPEPRLVVLDTLAGIRPARSNTEAMYDGDYKALLAIHHMASERRIAVLVLHHTRKLEADDPLDAISGTLGLAGCADGALVINRTAQGTSLYTRGRDIEERDSAISFDKATCRWSILGDAAEVQRSDGRRAILAALAGRTA